MEYSSLGFDHALSSSFNEGAFHYQQTKAYIPLNGLPYPMHNRNTQFGPTVHPSNSDTTCPPVHQVSRPIPYDGNPLASGVNSTSDATYPTGVDVPTSTTGTPHTHESSVLRQLVASLASDPGVSDRGGSISQRAGSTSNQAAISDSHRDARPVTSRLMSSEELPTNVKSRLGPYPFGEENAIFIPRLIDTLNGGPVHCSSRGGQYMCSVLLHATVIRIDIYLNAWDDTARSLKGMVYWNSLWPTQIEDANEYRRVDLDLRKRIKDGNDLEGLQGGWPRIFCPTTRTRDVRGPCPYHDHDMVPASIRTCHCPTIKLRNTYEFILEARTCTNPSQKDKIHVWFQPSAK